MQSLRFSASSMNWTRILGGCSSPGPCVSAFVVGVWVWVWVGVMQFLSGSVLVWVGVVAVGCGVDFPPLGYPWVYPLHHDGAMKLPRGAPVRQWWTFVNSLMLRFFSCFLFSLTAPQG
jgi:hypothetical protein